MKISILIPCHNEEKSIKACVSSCLNQTRPADEILVVNDGSTDKSGEILKSFGDKIKIIEILKATGNKSYAQEHGLNFVTGDIFITTDGDTILDNKFVELIEKDFKSNKNVVAVGGYIKSVKINWLTACRALEYAIGQNIHKVAQDYIDFVFVIPGAAGAFDTKVFKTYITFDHDTITEDLDFTYRLNKKKMKIVYDRQAIVYTQDPSDLRSYFKQMERWYGGGWQNLVKHFDIIAHHPYKTMELSLIYIEGLIFSLLLFIMPLISLHFFLVFMALAFLSVFSLAVIASIFEKRIDIVYYSPFYLIIMFINAWVFLKEFFMQVVLRKKNLVWCSPSRINLK